MRKLTLDLNALAVQSFATDEAARPWFGTVEGRQKGSTGQQDTECSAVDACPSGRGCSEIDDCRRTEDADCPSVVQCDTCHGCSRMIPCDPTNLAGCTVDCSAEA